MRACMTEDMMPSVLEVCTTALSASPRKELVFWLLEILSSCGWLLPCVLCLRHFLSFVKNLASSLIGLTFDRPSMHGILILKINGEHVHGLYFSFLDYVHGLTLHFSIGTTHSRSCNYESTGHSIVGDKQLCCKSIGSEFAWSLIVQYRLSDWRANRWIFWNRGHQSAEKILNKF